MNILIIDDHLLFSEGLELLIPELHNNVYIKSLSELRELSSLPSDFIPDLILLDYYFKNENSKSAISKLKEKFCAANIVIISSEESPAVIRSTLDEGADGYIPKSSDRKVLIRALKLVLAGGVFIPKQSTFHHSPNAVSGGLAGQLTIRQKEVLALTIQGKPNKVIANELNIAEGTVKAHLSAAFQILGVNNRTEAAILSRDSSLF